MKTINRMALGAISSLLLSAGLSRMAQKIDPLTKSIYDADLWCKSAEASSSNCVAPCFILQAPSSNCVAPCFILAD
jgi:hypothetical protein